MLAGSNKLILKRQVVAWKTWANVWRKPSTPPADPAPFDLAAKEV